jgi:hypothetical protein
VNENGKSPTPRLALRPEEAAAALGVSRDHFDARVAPELRWVCRGQLRIVAVAEVERWLAASAARSLIEELSR